MERYAEHKARELGYDHTYEPHSCRHCSCIVLDQAAIAAAESGEHLLADQLSGASNVVLASSFEDAMRARDESCPLFGYLLGELIDLTEASPAILDIDGTGTVYGSLTAQGLKLSHKLGGLTLMNMLKVSIQSDNPAASLDCDPASPEAFELSRQWISSCVSSHPLCRDSPSSFMPTRLLEIRESDVKLRESREIGKGTKWCALSYVWGGDQPVKTTKASLGDHHNGIALDRLPQALRDAVRACRALRIPYLWIDALCIVQDDPGDLRTELSCMPGIYQRAAVTISAASATKADDGFLFRRGHWYHECPPVRLQAETESGELVAVFAYERRLWEKEPIARRAWTYQERILSPRVLSYRVTLLEWTCRTRVDSYGLLEPTTLRRNKMDPPEPPYLLSSKPWSDVVEEYSLRSLSFGADKLRALSAIARVYHRETGKTYLAGLWKEDLPLGLCWVRATHHTNSSVPRPTEYRAPSWSWASIDSPVVHLIPHPTEQKLLRSKRCEVLSTTTTPHYEGGEFDSIASGSLVIQGAMKSLGALPLAAGNPDGTTEIQADGYTLVVTLDAEDDGTESVEEVWLMLLAEFFEDDDYDEEEDALPGYVGLVLREAAGQHDVLYRIGSFQCCDGSDYGDGHERCQMILGDFEDRRVTLV